MTTARTERLFKTIPELSNALHTVVGRVKAGALVYDRKVEDNIPQHLNEADRAAACDYLRGLHAHLVADVLDDSRPGLLAQVDAALEAADRL